jgi:hypothetical protein
VGDGSSFPSLTTCKGVSYSNEVAERAVRLNENLERRDLVDKGALCVVLDRLVEDHHQLPLSNFVFVLRRFSGRHQHIAVQRTLLP